MKIGFWWVVGAVITLAGFVYMLLLRRSPTKHIPANRPSKDNGSSQNENSAPYERLKSDDV